MKMNSQIVAGGMILLAIVFYILQMYYSTTIAFFVTIAIMLIVVFGIKKHKLNEGLTHDTKFDDLYVIGSLRIKPDDSSQTSVLDFGDTYHLKGRAYGTVS